MYDNLIDKVTFNDSKKKITLAATTNADLIILDNKKIFYLNQSSEILVLSMLLVWAEQENISISESFESLEDKLHFDSYNILATGFKFANTPYKKHFTSYAGMETSFNKRNNQFYFSDFTNKDKNITMETSAIPNMIKALFEISNKALRTDYDSLKRIIETFYFSDFRQNDFDDFKNLTL